MTIKVYKFLLSILFLIYRKTKSPFFLLSLFNNIYKGLPWKLAYFDLKISQLNNPQLQHLELKNLLKNYFLIASVSSIKCKNYEVFLNKHGNKKKIIKQLSNINQLPEIECLTYLKNLSNYFQFFKSFEDYLFIRQFYRKKLIELQMRSKILNLDTLRACLEQDQIDLAKKFILTKKISIFNRKKVSEIYNYILLLKKTSPKKFIKQNNKDDKKYLSIVNKSFIIIEGPALKKKNIYAKKDQILVKVNEIKKQSKYKVISYYNGGSVERNSRDIEKVIPSLLFTCFKTKGSFYSLAPIIWRKNYNARVYYNVKNILLNKYGALSIQNIIYDLLMCSPKKIFLTGVTFYLGKKLYKKNYIGPNFPDTIIAQGLRTHEPFSNFNFIKNLWERGLITADKEVINILKLSELKYALKLDKKYG